MTEAQVLLLPLAGDFYALPMASVREVVTAPVVTRLVTAPGVVRGLFNLRGEVVPLFDTAVLLGLRAAGETTFAVVVEAVEGRTGLSATDLPMRGVLGAAAGESELPAAGGLFHVGDRVAALLDVGKLLRPPRVGGPARSDLVEESL